jgi:mRNA interferase MazF
VEITASRARRSLSSPTCSTHASLLVCLLTTELVEATLFPLTVHPSEANGLQEVSQIMADKVLALPRHRIRKQLGTLDDETILGLNRSLALMLGLAGI